MLLVWALLLDDVTLIPKIFWKSLAFFFFLLTSVSVFEAFDRFTFTLCL